MPAQVSIGLILPLSMDYDVPSCFPYRHGFTTPSTTCKGCNMTFCSLIKAIHPIRVVPRACAGYYSSNPSTLNGLRRSKLFAVAPWRYNTVNYEYMRLTTVIWPLAA